MRAKAKPTGVTVYFLPIQMRMPLKFGKETVTEVVCCRVKDYDRCRRKRQTSRRLGRNASHRPMGLGK
jgi:hypothetical protein